MSQNQKLGPIIVGRPQISPVVIKDKRSVFCCPQLRPEMEFLLENIQKCFCFMLLLVWVVFKIAYS